MDSPDSPAAVNPPPLGGPAAGREDLLAAMCAQAAAAGATGPHRGARAAIQHAFFEACNRRSCAALEIVLKAGADVMARAPGGQHYHCGDGMGN